MSASPLKCAVVGVGYLGRFHAQKYKQIDGAELVGVFDQNQERCEEIAEELEVKAFKSLNEVVVEVQAVTVASSTESHYEVAKMCLEAGIHVNVEKPITSTCAQAEELVALAKANNLKLQVGHVERFNPAFQAVQDRLKAPLFIEVHRLAPFKPRGVDVNVVLDLMIHDIDVVLTLVKEPVKSVSAVGTPVLTPTIDICNARIEFESGAIANLTASRVSQQSTRKFRVFQQDQYLAMDFGAGEVQFVNKMDKPGPDGLPIETETLSLEKGDALFEETKAFVSAIVNDTECEVTGEHGLIAMRLAEQVSQDIEKRL